MFSSHYYRFIRIALICCFALGFSACTSFSTPEPTASQTPQPTFIPEPPTATPEPMALIVNGGGITIVEFNAEVQRYLTSQQSLGKTATPQEAVSVVKDDLI